ncbi:MAG: flagellar basal body L-ring protein FlgH [Verrucomicrobiales bacterium]|nr:flagellar basal body L-ring protein FlgH [Verrucomicrobiales bacterium]
MIKWFKSKCSRGGRLAGWSSASVPVVQLAWVACSLWSQVTPTSAADAIFTEATQAKGMFSDRKAVHVGDLLSVIVQETSTATKDVSTKTAKSSSVDAGIDSFFFSPTQSKFLTKGGALPALKLASQSDFDGSGKINNSEKLVARVQVVVKDVLPNGNLVVEGKRQTAYSGETQDMVLRGIVRPADVTPNNTVFSYQVAEATINIVSKGVASNSTKKGWFTRIWDKVAPF